MLLEGWNKINFNWDKNASIYFYGCNTANTDDTHSISFSQKISNLSNFQNINVYGQVIDVHFSKSNTEFIDRKEKLPIHKKGGKISFPITYMVSTKWGKFKKLYNGIYPLTHYINNHKQ